MELLGEADIELEPLSGRRIGIIGYGNQGRAQALNLRDAGLDVRVGARRGGPSAAAARDDGFQVAAPPAVSRWADVVMLLVPDEHQPSVLAAVGAGLVPGDAVGLAHGFNVSAGRLAVPPGIELFLVAPCAPGSRLREAYLAGIGVFAYVAARDGDEGILPLALAYARAIGCARAGVLITSIREETEVDLFGEQAVLCGGLHALLTAAYDTLVEAGYPAEMAYLECIHQLVWLAATVQREGIAGTRRSISSLALYGDLTRGPRVIGEASRDAMRRMLDEIRSGSFAEEFLSASRNDFATVRAERERLDRHPLEEVGRRLRQRLAGDDSKRDRPQRDGLGG